MYDTLLQQMNPGEVAAVVGHELGHWKLGHTTRQFVVQQAKYIRTRKKKNESGFPSCYTACYPIHSWTSSISSGSSPLFIPTPISMLLSGCKGSSQRLSVSFSSAGFCHQLYQHNGSCRMPFHASTSMKRMPLPKSPGSRLNYLRPYSSSMPTTSVP